MFWKSKIKISKQKIIVFLCSLALVLVVVELLVRSSNFVTMPRYTSTEDFFEEYQLIDNDKIVYTYNPGGKFNHNSINSQGFRGKEFIFEKKNNLVRIAMLGDSITAGSGVAPEENFCYLLEKNLNSRAEESLDAMRFEVMNFSVAGYRLEAMVEVLRVIALKYSPDIVVLNYDISDGGDVGFNFLFKARDLDKKEMAEFLKKRFKERNSASALIRKFFFKSKLCVLLTHSLSDIYLKLMPSSNNNYEFLFNDKKRYFHDNLLKIKQMQKSHGFKVLICVHPTLVDQEEQGWGLNLKRISEKAELHYFQMLSYYKKGQWRMDELRQNKYDIIHPNIIGHSIIAQAMLEQLIEHKLIFIR